MLVPAAAARHGLCVVAQVLIEYWVAATRPIAQNGFGLSPEHASSDVSGLRAFLPCLPEPADVIDRWFGLVTKHRVSGKPGHDARLVAVMQRTGSDDS